MCLLTCIKDFFSPRRSLHHVEVASWGWLQYSLNFEPLEMLSSPNLISKKNNGCSLTNDSNCIRLDSDLRNRKWDERRRLSPPSWVIAGPKQNWGEQWQLKKAWCPLSYTSPLPPALPEPQSQVSLALLWPHFLPSVSPSISREFLLAFKDLQLFHLLLIAWQGIPWWLSW